MKARLKELLRQLASRDAAIRESAALEIFDLGCASATQAIDPWLADAELSSLLGAPPQATVGVAVHPNRFHEIRTANGSPRLADVPPDQDALEFELHFANAARLDVLTTRDPAGSGAIAGFLRKLGEGVQQVEFRCRDVDRAAQVLGEKFAVPAIYPAARPGADASRVNFFLVSSPSGQKVLIELCQPAARNL